MRFKPGAPLSSAEAADLNQLWQDVQGLKQLQVSAPLSMSGGGSSPKVISVGDLEFIKKGILDEELTEGGSATMSVWRWNSATSAEEDTDKDITVYDWLLTSGQTIAADTKVIAYREGSRWYVFAASCS